MTSLSFTAYGVSQPKGSTRAFVPKGWKRAIVTNANPNTKDWQRVISASAAVALQSSAVRPFTNGPVSIAAVFYLPRPKKFLVKKYAAVDVPHVCKPDLDKLVRCAKDALTKVVWNDDAQVVDVVARKRYCADGAVPRVEITVAAVAVPTVAGRESKRPTLFGQEEVHGEARSEETHGRD